MANRKNGQLKNRQLDFIREYMIDFNASQAAIRAGYAAKGALQYGHQLLSMPEIQAAILAEQRKLTHASGITHRRVVNEAARLAFSDIRKVFAADGSILPIHELDDATAAAISSVKVIMHKNGKDVEAVREIKFWDKNSAIEKLMKHLGVTAETVPGDQLKAITIALNFEAVRAKMEQHVTGAKGA